MEKKYFPLYVDISEQKIVVIGGGVIATRRVNTLLEFAGQITVVSPDITEQLREMFAKGQITWLCSEYCTEQITDADMVIAATNCVEVNHQVKRDCRMLERERGRQILVSVVDDKTQSDFFFPSIVQNEDVIIGINSGGTNPGRTKDTRKKIETLLACDSIYDR